MTLQHVTITGADTWLASRELTLRVEGQPDRVLPAPLGGDLSLPWEVSSVERVVVSDLLEDMDPGTVYRLLLDIHRVLTPEGFLEAIIPDAESLARVASNGNLAALCTFKTSLENAAWTAPQVDPATLDELRSGKSVGRFVIDLVNAVIDEHDRCIFGRQSAWEREEFLELLTLVGFRALGVQAYDNSETSNEPRLLFVAAPTPVGDTTSYGDEEDAARTGYREFAEGLRLGRDGDWEPAFERLRMAVEAEPALGQRHYRLLYKLQEEGLRAQTPPVRAPSKSFAATGVHVGTVPPEVAQAVRQELHAVPAIYVRAEQSSAGYLSNPNLSPDAEVAINRDNTYLDLQGHGTGALTKLLEALAPDVEACLQTPFRVVNVRAWRTEAHARRVESNGWHRDEPYPPTVLKIIAYLSEASKETGSTEVVHPDGMHSFAAGPAGTFLIFRNSELIHRGYPPQVGIREIVEITLSPHSQRDLRIVCAGNNADFPYSPWAVLDELEVPKSASGAPSQSFGS